MNAPAKVPFPKAPITTRIRQAFSLILGTFTPATIGGNIVHWTGSASAAGQTVSETTVLKLSAAKACTQLISETIGSLPLILYERTRDGRQRAESHRLYRILHNQPNVNSTAGTFWESMTVAGLMRGNGFAEKLFIGPNLVGLNFLSPAALYISVKPDGSLKFVYAESNGRQRVIPTANIFHVPGFSLDGKTGISAIQYGAEVFGSAQAAQYAANNTFDTGLLPTTAFKYPHQISPDQRADFKAYAASVSGALNAGEAVVLEGGMEPQQIGISPNDAQLLQSRAFSVEEVCRFFRVDPSLVGHTEKSTSWGTGLEQKMLHFLMFTLRPWLTRFEQQVNRQLLTPAEQTRYYAEFAIEGLLRADSAGRSAFYQTLVTNGIMTRDEVRRLENMPPMGGNADVLTVNAATVPLDGMTDSRSNVQLTQAVGLAEFWNRNKEGPDNATND